VLLCAAVLLSRSAQAREITQNFFALAEQCAPSIDRITLAALIGVESGYNPYAIGVVNGRLARQPQNATEALATVHELERLGYNFSLGLGQINRYNLAQFAETDETMFEPCENLRIAATILQRCFARAASVWGEPQAALRGALSCYYSGNFSTGFSSGYVGRVVANADSPIVVRAAADSGAIPLMPPKIKSSTQLSLPLPQANLSSDALHRPYSIDKSICRGMWKVWIACDASLKKHLTGGLCVRCMSPK